MRRGVWTLQFATEEKESTRTEHSCQFTYRARVLEAKR